MKILYAASEAHPLVKTGGLGDVAGALPRALLETGESVEVRLVLPNHAGAAGRLARAREICRFPVFGREAPARLIEGRLPGSRLTVWLVDAPEFFAREGHPYVAPNGRDWPDNAQRFAWFARAVVELAQDRAGLGWRADLVHANDWQTGLVPALLSLEPDRPATVFTIHNLAYQGLFDAEMLHTLALPPEWWSLHALEFHGHLSFIKGGLVFADWLTTVSPTYAREITTPQFGCGLEGLLQARRERLVGILNGVDYRVWNPAKDPWLPAHYNRRSLQGKAACKAALQKEMGLPRKPDVPLFAHIGRLVEQKGVDLILECLGLFRRNRMQLVILGSGDPALESALRAAKAAFPRRIGIHIGYDEGLAHRIEAGADAFLMPSRFEPCGLNQLYSLRYATPPIVHRTGGLADTVVDADEVHLADRTATGFQFDEPTPEALRAAWRRALKLYHQPRLWRRMQKTGMRQDFSWRRSAREYLDLYRRALAQRSGV
ncbi:MAG: glycogen synthase GlgA [Gammaproteobacteria bacterium]|nr:MAG: glycogen synthase GlgA [Gammaproteobacteria bacterium]